MIGIYKVSVGGIARECFTTQGGNIMQGGGIRLIRLISGFGHKLSDCPTKSDWRGLLGKIWLYLLNFTALSGGINPFNDPGIAA